MSDCLDALYQCRSNHGSSDAMNVSQVPSAVCALQIAQQFAAKAVNRLSQQQFSPATAISSRSSARQGSEHGVIGTLSGTQT